MKHACYVSQIVQYTHDGFVGYLNCRTVRLRKKNLFGKHTISRVIRRDYHTFTMSCDYHTLIKNFNSTWLIAKVSALAIHDVDNKRRSSRIIWSLCSTRDIRHSKLSDIVSFFTKHI